MIAACLIVVGFGLAVVPWTIVAVRGLGGRLGATLVAVSALTAVLLASVISSATVVPLAVAMVGVAALFAGSGLVTLFRLRSASRPGRPRPWPEWCASGVGGAAWLISVGVAAVFPGGVRVGWVLAGDGFNNIELARLLATADGPFTGPDLNPAPLPALLVTALGGAGGTTANGVVVLAVLWSLGIVASSLVMGLLACTFIDPVHRWLRALVAGIASLLPLTVLVGTLPMYWGFLNAALVVPIVLVTVFALTDAARHPLAALATAVLLVTLALVAWAPLAAVPATAAVAIGFRFRMPLRAIRGVGMLAVLVPLLVVGVVATLVVVPAFFGSVSGLATDGIGFPVLWGPLAALAAGMVAVLLGGYRRHPDVLWSVAAWGVGVAAAIVGTVVLAAGDPFGYYPVKIVWFCVVGSGVLLIGLLAGWLARAADRRLATLPAVAAVALAAMLPVATPGASPLRPAPVALFTGGLWWGGAETERLVAVVTRDDAPALLWRTGAPDEGLVDMWAMLDAGGGFGGDKDLRLLAFDGYRALRAGHWQGGEAEALCRPLARIDGLVVYTADPGLAAEVEGACGVVDPTVLLVTDSTQIR